MVQTLKHEMAHMIVSEIWHDIPDNGNSHGELFKKACAVMDVDSAGSHSSIEKAEYRLPENERIVEKIHKLFCLGESNYEKEARAAVMKAEELMIKYNISMRDLPKEGRVFVARPVGNLYTKVPSYVVRLSRIISDHYFVKHIFITHYDQYSSKNCRRGRYITFFGDPSLAM